jgi:TPR repeat protein
MSARRSRTTHVCGGILVGLWLSAVSGWAGFEEGWHAYERGDYATALREWLPLAQQGHVTAQFNLGVMYNHGQGVPQDYSQALLWYQRAAAQGNGQAKVHLGTLYFNGQGVPQDYAQAALWYRQAAAQGDAHAQTKLGSLYENGQGVPQDYQQAAQWYRRAAAQGDTEAQYKLGLLYEKGHGVSQDYVQAHLWFNLAAARLPPGERELAVSNRDRMAALLAPAQIAWAQDLARTWQPKPEHAPQRGPSEALQDDASTRIRRAQERLSALGFAPGPIDGVLGPRMRAALRQFQRTKRLPPTGELDAATWRALEGR